MKQLTVMKKEGDVTAGANILIVGHKCFRCGHEWISSEKGNIPKVCPSCKNPYWDRPKTRFTKADKEKKKHDK